MSTPIFDQANASAGYPMLYNDYTDNSLAFKFEQDYYEAIDGIDHEIAGLRDIRAEIEALADNNAAFGRYMLSEIEDKK